jgi:hypothetical protein
VPTCDVILRKFCLDGSLKCHLCTKIYVHIAVTQFSAGAL